MCGHLDGLKGTKKGEIASRWEGREVAVKCPLCDNGRSGTSWGCAPPTATSRFGYSLAYPARTRRCSGFPGGPDPGPVAGHSASRNVLPRYIRLVADVPDPIAQTGFSPPLLEGTLQGPPIRRPAMAHGPPILAYAAAHTLFIFASVCVSGRYIRGFAKLPIQLEMPTNRLKRIWGLIHSPVRLGPHSVPPSAQDHRHPTFSGPPSSTPVWTP